MYMDACKKTKRRESVTLWRYLLCLEQTIATMNSRTTKHLMHQRMQKQRIAHQKITLRIALRTASQKIRLKMQISRTAKIAQII